MCPVKMSSVDFVDLNGDQTTVNRKTNRLHSTTTIRLPCRLRMIANLNFKWTCINGDDALYQLRPTKLYTQKVENQLINLARIKSKETMSDPQLADLLGQLENL